MFSFEIKVKTEKRTKWRKLTTTNWPQTNWSPTFTVSWRSVGSHQFAVVSCRGPSKKGQGFHFRKADKLTASRKIFCLFSIQAHFFGFDMTQWRRNEGTACPECHHFGVTPFYDTNRTKKKTTMCLISLKMLSTLEWTKNDLKYPLKLYLEGERRFAKNIYHKSVKTLKNRQH